jgi:hypothetical protein
MGRIITSGSQAGASRQGRRARQPVPRTRRVEITLSGEEYAIITDAARQAGLARAAYAASAVMTAAANRSAITGQEPLEQVLTELMHAAGLVRRISTNVGQAVATLNATGQRPPGTCSTPPAPCTSTPPASPAHSISAATTPSSSTPASPKSPSPSPGGATAPSASPSRHAEGPSDMEPQLNYLTGNRG